MHREHCLCPNKQISTSWAFNILAVSLSSLSVSIDVHCTIQCLHFIIFFSYSRLLASWYYLFVLLIAVCSAHCA